MITSTLAFGKASASGHNRAKKVAINLYSTASSSRLTESSLQRGLVVDVLTANATKRDAKQYLARFKPGKPLVPLTPELSSAQLERNARHRINQDRLDRIGVNLGGLYAPARAIADSPQFERTDGAQQAVSSAKEELHVALVCLRAPEALDDSTLDGVALTLSQLVKLDMRILLVLDCATPPGMIVNDAASLADHRKVFVSQAARLCAALSAYGDGSGRVVSEALEVQHDPGLNGDSEPTTTVSIGVPKLLMDPLRRGVIPVVPSFAYTLSGQLVRVPTSSVMSALTKELSSPTTGKMSVAGDVSTSLDRIIMLDSLGGIPSKARGDGAHVFINLEQEYEDIETELLSYAEKTQGSNFISESSKMYEQHRANLATVRECLAILPSASSALIVTPGEAATSSQPRVSGAHPIHTGTRRQKNTLIHNLLTNKPVVSSSLPVARLPVASTLQSGLLPNGVPTSTLIKRGMPLTIIPTLPHGEYLQQPESGTTTLSLEDDPRVDLPRLVHLIESSFRRKLDVQHYLSRIRHRLAGLIIAGEYEGGAILTWEKPPGPNTSPSRLVPYLDKFAVLPSSQGSSGVADIVFQAMVRTCFPHGVCWRSRRDNPVNKWYFERSSGTWGIPDSQWTMFWTGDGVVEDRQRWEDYVAVCRSVKPSWADQKAPD